MNWLVGNPRPRQQPKRRRQTFDSGIGMAESVVSRPDEDRRARETRHTHRTEKTVVKARKAIGRKTYTIDDSIITTYLEQSKLWRPTKHELWALVMPMAHGKTTLKRKYGFIDVDDLMPGIVSQQAVDNLAVEISLRADWNSGMTKFVDEAERNLSVLKFNGPVVILVHDWATANRLGARVMGSFYLQEEPFRKALKGRTPFQKQLAELNRQIVIARDEQGFDCQSLDEIEELCLQMCMTNNIPTGAPCKFRDFENLPGYNTDNESVVRGDDVDLDMLIDMYNKFEIPKERVDFEIMKKGLDSYRGFGITPGKWCETVAGSTHKAQLRFDGMARSDMAHMQLDEDKECEAIFKAHPDELGAVLCAHWRTVGRHADDPECVFRLYLIQGDRFQSAIDGTSRLLAKSKFFMDMELSKKDRYIINDMRWLSPKRYVKIQASGVVDITPDKPSLGSACTQTDLVRIIEGMDIVSEPKITRDGCEALMFTLTNETQHYMRDFMIGSLEDATAEDTIVMHMEGETVQTAVLRNILVLMAQNNHVINDEMLESVAKMVGYDKRYFEDVWYQMLLKANLLDATQKEKLTRAIVAVMWCESGGVYDDWSLVYAKAVEEIITHGKACLAMTEKNGAKHCVIVANDGTGYVLNTFHTREEWITGLALSNVDVRKSKVINSEESRMINAQRCLREMTKSQSLAIADMFSRNPHKHKRAMGMLGHAAEVLPDTQDCKELLTTFLLYNKITYKGQTNIYQWAKTVAFSSTVDNGLGGIMEGGMEYRPTRPLSTHDDGRYRTVQKIGGITKRQKLTPDYTKTIKMLKINSTSAVNCPSRRIATHGLSCADMIEQMCEREDDKKQMSTIIKA